MQKKKKKSVSLLLLLEGKYRIPSPAHVSPIANSTFEENEIIIVMKQPKSFSEATQITRKPILKRIFPGFILSKVFISEGVTITSANVLLS
jgi:hypothetical protein